MARRPDPVEFDQPLTAEQLKALERSLALLSPSSVEKEYQRAYDACKMNPDMVPRASSVQTLVAAWKVLWRWRRKRRPVERG